MNNTVLDASALLALIQQEQGAEIIKPLLKFSVMSAVNIAECLTDYILSLKVSIKEFNSLDHV